MAYPKEPFTIPSNVELCHTLFYLTNVAYGNNDQEGVDIYIHTMKTLVQTRRFSWEDMEKTKTLLFVLYGHQKRPYKPGLVPLPKKRI